MAIESARKLEIVAEFATEPGDTGSPRRDDAIDGGIGYPGPELSHDIRDFVFDDNPRRHNMTGCLRPRHQGIAGTVIGQSPGIGHGHHSDIDRHERPGFINRHQACLLPIPHQSRRWQHIAATGPLPTDQAKASAGSDAGGRPRDWP